MVDKPAGVTSHDVVAEVRRLFSTRAVGHTGTLDPFATGLLVMVMGRATRLARFVEAGRKTYLAEARLGVRTQTDDATGSRIDPSIDDEPWPTEAAVREALLQVQSTRMQVPPTYSAKRVQGRRSYRLAREGRPVHLDPVAVEIEQLELVSYAPPLVGFRAVVGPGTYIRAIARDLGERLAIGGHLLALRRVGVGPFHVRDATRLDRLTGTEPLLPTRRLVGGLATVVLASDDATAVRHGRPVTGPTSAAGVAALIERDEVVAIAEGRDGRWQPVVVLA